MTMVIILATLRSFMWTIYVFIFIDVWVCNLTWLVMLYHLLSKPSLISVFTNLIKNILNMTTNVILFLS